MLPFFSQKSSPIAAVAADAVAQADACIEAAFALEDAHQWEAAIEQYHAALVWVPEYWRALVNLGGALKATGQWDAAREHYQRAYAQNPDAYGTCYNLAADHVRLGLMAEAVPLLQRAIELKPDFADAMVLLAEALEATGQLSQSVQWLERALASRPEDIGILYNLLDVQENLGLYAEGEITVRRMMAVLTPSGGGWDFLAEYAKSHGEIARAIAHYQAIPEHGWSLKTWSNYLMNLAYVPGLNPVWLLGEHRKFNRFVDAAHPLVLPAVKRTAPRRIGFISPDLRGHPVSDFVVGLFERLDRSQFEIWAYNATEKSDAMTDRLKRAVTGWREIRDMPARAAAELIASDQIDILIDLGGHTAGARLDVLALKPAPVTATWLGYPCTTGVDGVDFRIVDGYTDPPGMTQTHHSEQLLRLPHAQWCYTPWRDFLPVSDLPALQRGYVTFASFGTRAKISDSTLLQWARLMVRVAGSRMVIGNIRAGHDRSRVTSFFEAQGVSADRLDFVQRTPSYQDYAQRYRQVDIVLDTHPYTGCTTICDAMYMGVPALTIAGQTSVSRCAASLLTHVGLHEWVCGSPEVFVEQGVRLVADLPALAALRAGLRQRMMASPVGDQDAFARDFAALLGEMWSRLGLVAPQ